MPSPSPFNSTRGLIASYYGTEIGLSIKETSLSVGTTAVAAGLQGAQRAAITFGNCGSNLIVVGFSAGVTATSGFPVPANGFLSFSWLVDGELVMGQFYAISGSSSQTLYICESVLSVVN
jgi:hypothetical protein